jgi:hypothetical protein
MTKPWEIRGHFPFGCGFAALGASVVLIPNSDVRSKLEF